MHPLSAPVITSRSARLAWSMCDVPGPSVTERRERSRRLLRELIVADRRVVGGFDLVQQCVRCGSGRHGRLLVRTTSGAEPAPLVSVSYSGALVVVGIAAAGATAFGIDAELDTPRARDAAAEALNRAQALGALEGWTCLEAGAKARGTGLTGDAAGRPGPGDAPLPCEHLRILIPGGRAIVAVCCAF